MSMEGDMPRRRVAALTCALIFIAAAALAQTPMSPVPRKHIKMGFAEYPLEALEKDMSGIVNVAITISTSGDVTTASILNGADVFYASAFKIAMGSRFAPDASTTSTTLGIEYFLTSNSWGVRVANFNGPDTSGAYRVGGKVRAPAKIHDVRPEYPEEARRVGAQGVVTMEARIDESGDVSDVRVLRSIPLLDQAAIDAVKQWKYATTIVNGEAAPVLITVTVNFALSEQVRLQLTLPSGDSRTMGISQGGTSTISTPALGLLQLKAVRTASGGATLSIYAEDGQTHLGDVALQPGGPAVASPTTPSFGIQMLR
jgi:TonB family protein